MLSQSYLTDDSSVHQVRQLCGFGFTARLGEFSRTVLTTHAIFTQIFGSTRTHLHKNNKIELSGQLLVAYHQATLFSCSSTDKNCLLFHRTKPTMEPKP